MTFSAVPFALQNGSHSADLFRQAVSSLIPPGGGIVTNGDLAVTQTGTPSMGVSIGVGRAWIPGTSVGNVAGGNFSSQAMYYGQNESAYTASVTTSDPINPRIDVVYAAVQDSQYSGSSNAGILSVVTGVPTSGAAYPANAPAIPSNAIALAYITVAANAASIVNANITSLAKPAIGGAPAGEVAVASYSAGTGNIAYNFLVIIADVTTPWIAAGRKLRITLETDAFMSASSGICALGFKTGGTTGVDNGTSLRNSAVSYQSATSTESSELSAHFTTTTAGPQRFYVISTAVAPSGATINYPANTRRLAVIDSGAV
jgi:hypothetical protein